MIDVQLITDRDGREQIFQLHSAETVVGRRHECQIRIPSSQVSRRHTLFVVEEDGYLTVEDLDSTNGTILNGEKIKGKHLVRPDDTIEIGPIKFRAAYELTEEAEAAAGAADLTPIERDEDIEILMSADDEDSEATMTEDEEGLVEVEEDDAEAILLEDDEEEVEIVDEEEEVEIDDEEEDEEEEEPPRKKKPSPPPKGKK